MKNFFCKYGTETSFGHLVRSYNNKKNNAINNKNKCPNLSIVCYPEYKG